MRTINDVCGRCQWFHCHEGGSPGTCRRFPTYTIRDKNAWCGEFSLYRIVHIEEAQPPPQPKIKRKRGRPFKQPQESQNATSHEIKTDRQADPAD